MGNDREMRLYKCKFYINVANIISVVTEKSFHSASHILLPWYEKRIK